MHDITHTMSEALIKMKLCLFRFIISAILLLLLIEKMISLGISDNFVLIFASEEAIFIVSTLT